MPYNTNSNDEEDIVVTLDLDDGTQIDCAILTIFDVKGQDYIALLPLDDAGEPNEDGDVYLYRYSEDKDGNPELDNIDNDEEYEAVANRFDELLEEDEIEELLEI